MSARQSKVLKAFSSLLQVPSSLSTHPSRHMLHLFPVYPWSESQVQIPVSSSHVIALSIVPSQLQSQPNNEILYNIKNSKGDNLLVQEVSSSVQYHPSRQSSQLPLSPPLQPRLASQSQTQVHTPDSSQVAVLPFIPDKLQPQPAKKDNLE